MYLKLWLRLIRAYTYNLYFDESEVIIIDRWYLVVIPNNENEQHTVLYIIYIISYIICMYDIVTTVPDSVKF